MTTNIQLKADLEVAVSSGKSMAEYERAEQSLVKMLVANAGLNDYDRPLILFGLERLKANKPKTGFERWVEPLIIRGAVPLATFIGGLITGSSLFG